MILNREIKPNWDIDQFWATLIVGFVLDIVLHYLAKRDSQGLSYGIGGSLMPYYNSLKYPSIDPLKSIIGPDSPTFKSWFYGGLLGGLALVFGLLFTDIFLEIVNRIQKKKEADKNN